MVPVSQRTVAILAFDDMEVLDFAGPYEGCNVAGELGEGHPFSVGSVGITGDPVGTECGQISDGLDEIGLTVAVRPQENGSACG